MGAAESLPVFRFFIRLKSNCCVTTVVNEEEEVEDETDGKCATMENLNLEA